MRNATGSRTVEESKPERAGGGGGRRKRERKEYRERPNHARVPAELTATSVRSWKNHGTTRCLVG